MTANSPRMGWPYPAREDDPWYDGFEDFVQADDASGFAHREDRNLFITGGGTLSWDAGTGVLTWTEAIQLVSPTTGFLLGIAADSVTIENGEVLYAVLVRQALEARTLTKAIANSVPSNDNAFMLCVRIGNNLHWRNGLVMSSGSSVSGVGFSGSGISLSIETGRADYVQVNPTVEEVVGQWMLDGAVVAGGVRFRCMMRPTFNAAGWARVRVYDLGAVGTPAAAVEITDDATAAYRMQATTSGLVYLETSVMTIGVSPGVGQIVNARRMYEATLEQSSLAGDTVDFGFAGVYVGV